MSVTLITTIVVFSWLLLGFIGWALSGIYINKQIYDKYQITKSDLPYLMIGLIGGPFSLIGLSAVIIGPMITFKIPDVIWEYKPKNKK